MRHNCRKAVAQPCTLKFQPMGKINVPFRQVAQWGCFARFMLATKPSPPFNLCSPLFRSRLSASWS